MVRLLRILWILVIILFVFISVSLVVAQAINDPASQANIRASHTTSKFISEINASSYYIDYDTKNKYCMISSTFQVPAQTTPNTSIVANRSGTILQSPNVIDLSTDSKVEATPPVTNKTVPMVINIYNSTVILSDKRNETIQPSANATVPLKDNDSGGNSLGPQYSDSIDSSATSTPISGANTDQESTFSDGRGKWKK